MSSWSKMTAHAVIIFRVALYCIGYIILNLMELSEVKHLKVPLDWSLPCHISLKNELKSNKFPVLDLNFTF